MPPSPQPDDFIQPEEIKTALAASGYLLEGRTGHALEAEGFYVEVNSFRADPRDEDKSIEIDVSGRMAEAVNEGNGSSVVAEVLIECKNNAQPFVFFLKAQPVREVNDNHIKYAGYPASSADPETKYHVDLHKLLAMKDWHHYCGAREVATQFCGFSRDSSAEEPQKQKQSNRKDPLPRGDWRWKAESMEQYSKSFGSLCVAAAWAGVGSFDTRQPNIQLEFYYPIVVFQGPIYEARAHTGNLELRATDHLQLHHSVSVGGEVIRAQIDVVSERGLPALIETIQAELKQIAEGVRGMYPRLLASAIDQKEVVSRKAAGWAMAGGRKRQDVLS